MWNENIEIDYDGVAAACDTVNNIKNDLEDALVKAQKLQDYLDQSLLSGKSIDALKAIVDLTIQLQKDINETFEKHVDAAIQLRVDMESLDYHEETVSIKNL